MVLCGLYVTLVGPIVYKPVHLIFYETWKRRITVLVQAFLSHAVVDQFNSLSKMQYLMTGKCHNVDSLLQFCYE